MLAYAPKANARKFSPASFALAVALPSSALAALLLAGPQLITVIQPEPPIVVRHYPNPPLPPPDVEPVEQTETQAPPMPVTQLPPIVPTQLPPIEFTPFPPVTSSTITTTVPSISEVGSGTAPITEIVREEATLLTPTDRRRPPYPERRRRMGDEAVLKLELTIGANGRVTSVQPVGDMPTDFLREAERHIKRVWRYAPATEDGRKVQSVKTITLRFELTDV